MADSKLTAVEPPTKRPKLTEGVEKRDTDQVAGKLVPAEILQRGQALHILFRSIKDRDDDFDLEDNAGLLEAVLQVDQDARIADETWWSAQLRQHEHLARFIHAAKATRDMLEARERLLKTMRSICSAFGIHQDGETFRECESVAEY